MAAAALGHEGGEAPAPAERSDAVYEPQAAPAGALLTRLAACALRCQQEPATAKGVGARGGVASARLPRRHALASEARRCWEAGTFLPSVGEGPPQMGCALLQQKLALLNYCVAKKQRKLAAADAGGEEDAVPGGNADGDAGPRASALAEDAGGRVGGRRPLHGLAALHSGAALWEPWTQDPVPMTGDVVEQQQEELIRVGERFGNSEAQTVLARLQSAQLKSDMQAFKAANPGCCLEDFIRWHSPRDWLPGAPRVCPPRLRHERAQRARFLIIPARVHVAGEASDADAECAPTGALSQRMRQPGSLWQQLWTATLPLAAAQQRPLFDADREAQVQGSIPR
jgi:Rab3 GTPase-activating protein catalytic subunit